MGREEGVGARQPTPLFAILGVRRKEQGGQRNNYCRSLWAQRRHVDSRFITASRMQEDTCHIRSHVV
jgi:hypothetical protein